MKRKMGIQKVLVFLCLVFFTMQSQFASGQSTSSSSNPTKKETEDWIIEKLTDYTIRDANHTYKYYFQGSKLMIYQTWSQQNFSGNFTVEIDILDILEIKFETGNPPSYKYLTFVSDSGSFIVKSDKVGRIKEKSVEFKTDAENDLEQRFNKAINHLQEFYGKKKEKF